MTEEEVAAVVAERGAQGLPPRVVDVEALAAIAAIIAPYLRRRP